MATISSPGIGSGLDINSIVSQLVAVERTPLNKLKTAASDLQSKLSTYGQIKAAISNLRDAANVLSKSETWGQTSATTTDSSSVAVMTSASSSTGTYSLEIQRLATAQANSTVVYPSADSLVGEGTLVIEKGTWSTDQSSFTAGSSVSIPVGPPAQSLAQLRDKINASGAGLVASVLTDASGSRLVFKASATGAANGFRVSVNDSDGNNRDGVGLSALAFDPSAGILTMAQAISAANAAATLNGLSISSASNSLDGVMDGLSLTLGKVTTAPVQITTSQNNTGIRKSLDDFVTAYNSLNTMLADQTKYDATSKKSSSLQGDSTAIAIRSQMRNLLAGTSGASSTFSRLSEVGFDVQQNGSIKINETKLNAGLTNVTEMRKLFGNIDTTTASNEGIATRIRRTAEKLVGFEGAISNRTDGLRKLVDRNTDKQSALEDRVAMYEKRLRQQYTALDAKMGELNGLQGYVTQQFSQNSNNN